MKEPNFVSGSVGTLVYFIDGFEGNLHFPHTHLAAHI